MKVSFLVIVSKLSAEGENLPVFNDDITVSTFVSSNESRMACIKTSKLYYRFTGIVPPLVVVQVFFDGLIILASALLGAVVGMIPPCPAMSS